MLTRKTRRMLYVLPIILIVSLIIIVTLIYLYTDMLKSKGTLFAKYIGQNIDNVDSIYNKIGTNQYNDLIKQNKYTIFSQIKVSYVGDVGTTLENRDNSINKLKLEINGQVDKTNKYNYQDIKLINNEDEVAEIEYSQKENTYGIRFSDLFNQFILVNNENLKDLFGNLGYSEDEIANIPDAIEIDNNLENILRFSEEEKELIKTKYFNIINSNVSKENFSKQVNQIIDVNEKSISTNAYVLTLTKEQLNNIYIKLLEEVMQDEIILNKINKIQEQINKYNSEQSNLREEFVEKIENIITNIKRNNIGQEETKVIVYENNKRTIRTKIQTSDYEIIIDVISLETEDYININYINNLNKEEKIIIYKKENNEINLTVQNKQEGNILENNSIDIKDNINGNSCERTIIIKSEDDSNSIQINVDQEIETVDNFENEMIFNDDNSINLSLLEEEQLNNVLEKVFSGVSGKINKIQENIIKKEEIWEIFNAVGIIGEQQFSEEIGMSEVEKNRFNSKIEILQGENLDGEAVLKVIEVIKPNLIDMNVLSNTELELQLDNYNNEEIVTTISSFIEQNKNRKYDVKVKYDELTELIDCIILKIVEN